MKISKEALNEFKIIYKEEFDVEQSDEELIEMARRVIVLYTLLLKKLPGEGALADTGAPQGKNGHPPTAPQS